MYKIAKERELEAPLKQACGDCAKTHIALASKVIKCSDGRVCACLYIYIYVCFYLNTCVFDRLCLCI